MSNSNREENVNTCQAHILLKDVLEANIHDLTLTYLIASSFMSVILQSFLRHFVFGFWNVHFFLLLLKPLLQMWLQSPFYSLFSGIRNVSTG